MGTLKKEHSHNAILFERGSSGTTMVNAFTPRTFRILDNVLKHFLFSQFLGYIMALNILIFFFDFSTTGMHPRDFIIFLIELNHFSADQTR